MRDVDGKGLLATAERAEIRHVPVQADQAKQALDEASRLPQRHAEKDLHRQAGLDGSVAVDGLSPPIACRLRRPRHVRIEPDRQRSAALERVVIRGPVQGLVGRCARSAHPPQLSRWIHKMNPSRDLCNRVPPEPKSPQAYDPNGESLPGVAWDRAGDRFRVAMASRSDDMTPAKTAASRGRCRTAPCQKSPSRSGTRR